MYDFDCKKALIIGATGGMGASVAAMLAKNGAHCAFVGRDKKKLEDILSICSSFGFPCFNFSCDIYNVGAIKKCLDEVISSL